MQGSEGGVHALQEVSQWRSGGRMLARTAIDPPSQPAPHLALQHKQRCGEGGQSREGGQKEAVRRAAWPGVASRQPGLQRCECMHE